MRVLYVSVFVCVHVCVYYLALIEGVVKILISMSGTWFHQASLLAGANQTGGEVREEAETLWSCLFVSPSFFYHLLFSPFE